MSSSSPISTSPLFSLGAPINVSTKMSDFLTHPASPLSAFVADLFYKFYSISLTTSTFSWPPPPPMWTSYLEAPRPGQNLHHLLKYDDKLSLDRQRQWNLHQLPLDVDKSSIPGLNAVGKPRTAVQCSVGISVQSLLKHFGIQLRALYKTRVMCLSACSDTSI